MVQMYKMIRFPGVFFNVKMLVFQVVKGVKGQKMAQNDESFCLSQIIYQESLYDLHLWYTCMYRRIISPGIFFIFLFSRKCDFLDH